MMISSEVVSKSSVTNRKICSRRSTHLVCKPNINKFATRTAVIKQRVVTKRLLSNRLSSTALPLKTKRYDAKDLFKHYTHLPYWPGHFEAYSLWSDVQDLDRWENQSYHGIKILKRTPFHHGLPQQKTRFKQFRLRDNLLDANVNRSSLNKHLLNVPKPMKSWHLIGMNSTRQNRDSLNLIKLDEMKTVLDELFPEYALLHKSASTKDQAVPCVPSGIDNTISDQTTSNTDNGVKSTADACHQLVDDADGAVPYVPSDDTVYFRACRLFDDEDVEMPYVPSGDLEDNGFFSSECQDITSQNTSHCQSYNTGNTTVRRLFDDEDVEMPYVSSGEFDDGYFSGEDPSVASKNRRHFQNINGNATVRCLFDDEDVEMPYVPPGDFDDGYSSGVNVTSENTRHQLNINGNATIRRFFDDEDVEMPYVPPGDFYDGHSSGGNITSENTRRINGNATARRLFDEDVEMLHKPPGDFDDGFFSGEDNNDVEMLHLPL